MGQDTEQLKREIESTRAGMGTTLDAIGDRVSPGRMVQRNKNRVAQSAQSLRDKVMGTVSDAHDTLSDTADTATDAIKAAPGAVVDHTKGAPMVAGALAFGIGFLVAAAFPATSKEKQVSSRVLDVIEPVTDEAVHAVHDIADHLKDPAIEAANVVEDAATDAVHSVTDTAQDAVADTQHQAADSVSAVKQAATPSP